MIVWGGDADGAATNTGGLYDPATDSWTATATAGAPTPREDHVAVWARSKMIVWGGYFFTNTGGIYDPETDSWTATATTGAPSDRYGHTAVWTGSKMIVWGGRDGTYRNSGALYSDPAVEPPGDFYTVTPCRAFDTRDPSGPTLGAPLACGTEQSFAIAGRCDVPSSATAVSLNLTGTASSSQGNLRLFPAGAVAPLVSTLNYVAGQTRANNAVAALGTDGKITVLCAPSGATHLILDVNGYFE